MLRGIGEETLGPDHPSVATRSNKSCSCWAPWHTDGWSGLSTFSLTSLDRNKRRVYSLVRTRAPPEYNMVGTRVPSDYTMVGTRVSPECTREYYGGYPGTPRVYSLYIYYVSILVATPRVYLGTMYTPVGTRVPLEYTGVGIVYSGRYPGTPKV